MEKDVYQEEFMKDDEFIVRINLDTKETRVYRGSQLTKRVIDEEVEPVEFVLRMANRE